MTTTSGTTGTISKAARFTAVRQDIRARRLARHSHDALAREMANFATAGELIELSAMLSRYDDRQTQLIRDAIRWDVAS